MRSLGEEIAIYKPPLSVMGGGLIVLGIVFFGLTLPLIIEGAPVAATKLLALGGFWLLGIVLTLPLSLRLCRCQPRSEFALKLAV
jgi:hypothetical protein